MKNRFFATSTTIILLLSLFVLSNCESSSQLPPGLDNTNVPYFETRQSYVPFPPEAEELLKEEIAAIEEPLVIEVTTTITHWTNPLWILLKGIVHRFRNQNQIIYVKAHYYVGDGLREAACRIVRVDPASGHFSEGAVDSPQCDRTCTNYGRYCVPEIPAGWNSAAQAPKVIVEETLRRLCIDDLYHASDLKHWEYLEAFSALNCSSTTTTMSMTDCAKAALARVPETDWSAVEECMELSGGLDNDGINVRLQEQLDRQTGSYALPNLPLLHIDGTLYSGPWDVASMFESICVAYPSNVMTPLACQFCGTCQDVRFCNWFLQCDGKPFDVNQVGKYNIYTDQQQGNNNEDYGGAVESTTTTTTATTTTPQQEASLPPQQEQQEPPETPTTGDEDNNNNNNNNDQEEENESNTGVSPVRSNGRFVGGILAGLFMGMLPALYFAWHEKQTRSKIMRVQAARAAAYCDDVGSYHDDDDGDNDNEEDVDHLGDSSSRPLDELGYSIGRSNRPTPDELKELEDVNLNLGSDGPPRFAFAILKGLS